VRRVTGSDWVALEALAHLAIMRGRWARNRII